jgi:hypothetical protein
MRIFWNGEILEIDCELYDPFPPNENKEKEEPKDAKKTKEEKKDNQ